MSTAANHSKRSHRSEYRKRPYQNGTARISMKPTVKKRGNFSLISIIRRRIAASMAAKKAAQAAVSDAAT